MPLSPAADREQLHQRRVTCTGYQRKDGLFDIEGHLVDVKTYDFPNLDRGGVIEAGDPLHEMWLRLTIDLDMEIIAAEAVTDKAPYSICPQAAPHYERLVGLRLKPGFRVELRRRLGGAEGCTHISEMLGPMATTAFQTLHKARRERRERQGLSQAEAGADRPGTDMDQKAILDSCYALRRDGPVVARDWSHLVADTQIEDRQKT